MSLLYREKDQTLYRDYKLVPDANVVSFRTKKASIDIVHSKEYGPMFFLDGVLQAAIFDEYIYHEFLVHIPMAYAKNNDTICILGGGDGCAAREVLKWKEVKSIDLYDWDAQLVDYFQNHGKLWNQGSLQHPNVFYQPADVTSLFPNTERERYDVILIDLLDPEYKDLQESNGFWVQLLHLAARWRKQGGSVVINAGGICPWQTDTFVLLKQLCRSIFQDLYVIPYKVFVPSFGREWGYLLIVEKASVCKAFPPFLRRLDERTFRSSYMWEPDFKIEG